MIDGQTGVEGTYLECSLQAALRLCDFDFLRGVKIEKFPNGKDRDTIERVKFLIHKYDFVQAGFMIDTSWYLCNNQDYVLRKGGPNCGGHAVNLVGYDGTGVYVQNQWGTSWGSKGFVIMPWDVFLEELLYGAYLAGIKY